MRVKEVKRKDNSKGYLVGGPLGGYFIHSERKMADRALPFAKAREEEMAELARKKAKAPKEYKWCRLSREEEELLTGTRRPLKTDGSPITLIDPTLVPVGNVMVDGAEFTQDEVRQVRRMKAGLPKEKFEAMKRLAIIAKREFKELGLIIDHDSTSRNIARCL
jgi:hypothetical protein